MTEPAAEIHLIDFSTDLAQSFDALEMDNPNGAQDVDPETFSSTARAAGEQEKVGFLSLPREVRDRIYLNLVVADDPIQYSEKFESLSRSGTFADTAMKWMFDAGSNSRIAEETRQTFYQYNTFLVYTHDIPALLDTRTHAMSFAAGKGLETTIIYSTPFDAGDWVRNLAVRVGWHSGGWYTSSCCCYPASDLTRLLGHASLRSVIIDARFGAWSYGVPQGINRSLLKEMNNKWGKEFRIYNDQKLEEDTRRYTSDRCDLTDIWFSPNLESLNNEGAETASAKSEQEDAGGVAVTASANSEGEDSSEDDEAGQHPSWSDYDSEERDQIRQEDEDWGVVGGGVLSSI